MNGENFNKIIDKAYGEYSKNTPKNYCLFSDLDPMNDVMVPKGRIDYLSGYPLLERLTKEEFTNRILNDHKFAEKQNVKIHTEVEINEVWMVMSHKGIVAKIRLK